MGPTPLPAWGDRPGLCALVISRLHHNVRALPNVRAWTGDGGPDANKMKLGVTDHIDCAHFLPGHPKCGTLHGHTYKIELIIEGEKGSGGMIADFDEVKSALRNTLTQYDHRSLNEFLDYPSVENICEMLQKKLQGVLKFPFTLRVWEGNGKWAEL